MTSTSPKLIASCPSPVDYFYQLASRLVHSFLKYHVHKSGNGRTDGTNGPGACSTAHRSNRPDRWDGLMLDRSAVGQLSSLSNRTNGSDCRQAILYVVYSLPAIAVQWFGLFDRKRSCDSQTQTFIISFAMQLSGASSITRTVLTRRVSSYGLPAWVSSELGPMGGTTFTTSAAALEPGHY